MKFLTEFSVKNSLLVNLLSLLILVVGVMSVTRLNREAFPNIDFDIVTVTTYYPGSTPEEVEKLITIPIEKELKSIDDVKEISSVSTEGISLISLQLEENIKNKQAVINDIQRAVDSVEDFPDDLPNKPFVRDIKTRDTPVIEVSLAGDLPEDQLRQYALSLEKKILDLDDVASVSRRGLRDKEIWVQLTPEVMQNQHVSFTEIIRALKAQNTTLPGGKFYDENHVEYILKTSGSFKDKEDVKKTVVRASTLGDWLTLGDIAQVTDEFEEESIINKTEGSRSIVLTVIKKEKGDAITLVDELNKKIAEFKSNAAPELKINTINDLSFYIKRRLNVLINNGIIGLIMVGISLFTFLSFGAALSACIGIPTALLMTFSMMNFFGVSINLLSLFGLIMVLGMLVDEDIVIAENVYRHIQEGETDLQAASIKGAEEVSLAVISTVMTTIVAFIPIYFMGGIMGKFTRHIPTVIIITLTSSLVEALLILPSHVAHLSEAVHNFKLWWQKTFKPKAKTKKNKKAHVLLDKVLYTYTKFLQHALKYRYLYLLGLFLSFGGSLILAQKNLQKFQLFPSKGVEIFFIRAEAKVGTSLVDMSQKMTSLENLVGTLDKTELDTYTTQVGILRNDPNDPNTRRGTHLAQITVYLTPENGRERDSHQIMQSLREKSANLTGFTKINFDEVRNGPPSGKPIEVRITGDDFDVMQKLADLYIEELQTIDGITDIKDDYDLDKDEIRIHVDVAKAAQMGLNLSDVAFNVRYAFEGFETTTIVSSEEEVGVLVKFPPSFRNNTDALQNLMIPNNKGHLVKLSQIATFSKNKSAQSILHFKNSRNINVTANLDENKIGILQVQNQLEQKMGPMLKDFPNYLVEFGGEGKRTIESLDDLKKAFIFSLVLIGVILIGTFRSFVLPLINSLIIPFTIIGVIVAFELHNENLSFMSILGIVALTGIVVDAGTIMIDFINSYRKKGHSALESILKGSAVRFRAVVLITLTTVMGLLPSAYGFGGNDPFITPMAMALNYGILFSTILTLIYVPIFLLVIEDIKNLLQSCKNRLSNR